MPPIEFFIAFVVAFIFSLLSGMWFMRLWLKKKKMRDDYLPENKNSKITDDQPFTKANSGNKVIALTRHSQEKILWTFGLVFAIYILCRDIFQGASTVHVITDSVMIPFLAWGTWFAFTKPDVLIDDGQVYLFGRLSIKPIAFSLEKILFIERQSKIPVWRVPPLTFHLKNGDKMTFSTGGSESRMKRIITFLEKETSMKIKYSE